jgi:hypothetical protein
MSWIDGKKEKNTQLYLPPAIPNKTPLPERKERLFMMLACLLASQVAS